MEPASDYDSRLARGLIAIFGSGLLVHALTVVLATSALADLRWENLPLHAAVEASGAMLALIAAYLLLRLERFGEGSSFNQRSAAALIAIGILDGLHAMQPAGQSFVWLHTCAIFAGGVLFVLVWLPDPGTFRPTVHWPMWVSLAFGLFGVVSLLRPESMPEVLIQGQFTPLFEWMNMTGGTLMLVAAVRFMLHYRRHRKVEDLMFFLQCLLFGFGALVIQQSHLWNASWWGSHLLRLIAYAATLWLLFRVAASAGERTRKALRVLELEANNLRLQVLSTTDGLTGIANRRCFDDKLLTEWRRAMRSNRPIALALVDVDSFKQYNDCYGHQRGDKCLQQVAKVLETCVRRSGDFVARYGGEEFAFVVPDASAEDAVALAESVRNSLLAVALPHVQSPYQFVTISVGVACVTPDEKTSSEELIKRADAALYKAKEHGRNRVELAS